MGEPPLSDHEIRTVRGMIDEYEFSRRRRLLMSQRWKVGRVAVLTVLGVTLYLLQILALLLTRPG